MRHAFNDVNSSKTCTAQELINFLQTLPKDATIWWEDYESISPVYIIGKDVLDNDIGQSEVCGVLSYTTEDNLELEDEYVGN